MDGEKKKEQRYPLSANLINDWGNEIRTDPPRMNERAEKQSGNGSVRLLRGHFLEDSKDDRI